MTHDDPHNPSDPLAAGNPPAHAHAEYSVAGPTHAHAPGEQTHFPAAEWQEFRQADWTAGAYIVVLMQGIFMVGLVLYLIVLWSVA